MQDLLRFMTCGSVDDGKSTLIGRLLYDTKNIFQDQLEHLKKDSQKYGSLKNDIDFALAVDGLQNEREQNITIDVAYRYFSTNKRKFIISDAPGHKKFTKNMATAASMADLLLVLIDVKKGVAAQTKRHSYIASLFGIKNIVVAVNKMDLVDYSEQRFKDIKKEFEKIVPKLLNHTDIKVIYIPVSALFGENIIENSKKMPWYKGKNLMKILEDAQPCQKTGVNTYFRFPVQYVSEISENTKGYFGSIVSGSIKVGDKVMVLPSKKTTKIKSILMPSIFKEKNTYEAFAPMAVVVLVKGELDIKRGDMFVKSCSNIKINNNFEAMIVWMGRFFLDIKKDYILKIATDFTTVKVICIAYKIDINNLERKITNKIKMNDIAKCIFKTDKPIVFDRYENNRFTGSFILIDKDTNDTVAAGMIVL